MGPGLVVTVVAVASAVVVSGCASSSQTGQPTATRPSTGTSTSTSTGGPAATSRSPSGGSTTRGSAAPTPAPTPAPTAAPTSAPVLRTGRPAWVAVSVATLWRAPSSPRAVDAPALRSPADIRGWLGSMTLAERRGLQGRADTQALLGDRLLVTAVRGTWARVVVPDQPTPLDARGYPGWVPTRQLSAAAPASRAGVATVVARTAWLRVDTAAASPAVEVSYGTRLPVLDRRGPWLRVGLPGGGAVRVDPRAVVDVGAAGPALPATGASMVQSAQSFTGLPYLWAGRSGFGFDCSGLTSLVYRVHGLVVPRDADAQAVGGRPVASGAVSPGDLLFYATPTGYVHHVSMYAGGGLMVQSPATGQSVQTIAVASQPYAGQFASARRYLP